MNILVLQILLQLLLIGLNAVFACAEIAVLEMSEAKLSRMVEEGNKKAFRLEKLKSRPARFLATIQVAITLSGFLGSAFAAENFSDILVKSLVDAGLKISAETLDTITVILITIILSFLTLVFGELVPKRIAMRKAEKIALGLADTICAISKIFAPLVWLLTISTNGILRLLGMDPNEEESDVSEEEIRMMADAGTEMGVIDEQENILIQNVFEFDDLSVGEIMTHRTEVEILWNEDSIEEWKDTIYSSDHTFYPICGESVDEIIGILDARRFFRLQECTKENALASAMVKPMFVSAHTKADDLFKEMKVSRNRFAIVIDEFGGTDGIITINDLIEQLVGELEENFAEIARLDEDCYKIEGDIELSKVERLLKIDLESDLATLSGWIVEQMGTIPKEKDTVSFGRYEFIVCKTDEKRVLEAIVKVHPLETETN